VNYTTHYHTIYIHMSNEFIVVKQVLKLYDMKVNTAIVKTDTNSQGKYVRIKTTITFTPKEISTISPETVKSWGVFDYREDSSRLFLDMVYLRDSDMPILTYIDDDYGLDVFLTEIVETETKKKFEKVRHKL
jgi:hypothetical protein